MSSDALPVVEVESLSKSFRIYDRPRDRLKQLLHPGKDAGYYREFQALDDVNFKVYKGQTVGILGQNGSGKSTLLQIITGTMQPTRGSVTTRGKIAALLELGSGFNPEFTGVENVYLNGSLLGLTRAEIDAKFDDIAAFADIGEHIHQTVKTYSSGMMLRLAFAVQVAIETELLIIDEALAVGDARFQMKCFRRLEELKARGTTILFVSHATDIVRSFCDYGLVLDKGKTFYWGEARAATMKYMTLLYPDLTKAADAGEVTPTVASDVVQDAAGNVTIRPEQDGIHTFGAGGATLESLQIHGLETPNVVLGGSVLRMRCRYSWDKEFVANLIKSEGYKADISLGIAINDKKGLYLFGGNSFDAKLPVDCVEQDHCEIEAEFTMPHLVAGDYFLTVAIALGDLQAHAQLKWYDNLVQLRYMEADKKVFGLMAVPYHMRVIGKNNHE